jgi:hypothetical protein
MLKTKFTVQINAVGEFIDNLTRMIGNHNAGLVTIDLEVIKGFVKARQAEWPTISKSLIKQDDNDPSTIHISQDNGETYYLSITECTYEALEENKEGANQDKEIIN